MGEERQEVSAAIADSLVRAGLPSGYVNDTVTRFPLGREFLAWLEQEEAVSNILRGTGITLMQNGLEGTDTFYMIARTLHIVRCPVFITSLPQLVYFLKNPDNTPETFYASSVLCIHRFQGEAETPLNRWQREQVEELILERRGASKSNLLHSVISGKKQIAAAQWWSESIVDLMFKSNVVFPRGES